jgi:hypothetical protein
MLRGLRAHDGKAETTYADFRNEVLGTCGYEPSLDHVAEGVVEAAATGLSRGVSAALADPIVQALMAADRVDPKGVEELLRRITAQLASQPDRWRFS